MDRVVGVDDARVDAVDGRTPEGRGRLELTKFHAPKAISAGSTASNTLGLRRIMFAVDDIDVVVPSMQALAPNLSAK